MSTETEQYRERLYDAYVAAFEDRAADIVAGGGDATLETILECRLHGTEAVAAQVLWDLMEVANGYTVEDITDFAAERGIDLEEGGK